jgi:hypothetical protein
VVVVGAVVVTTAVVLVGASEDDDDGDAAVDAGRVSPEQATTPMKAMTPSTGTQRRTAKW